MAKKARVRSKAVAKKVSTPKIDHPLAKYLEPEQVKALAAPTPPKYIYKRPGRGGMNFDYVSIGYVVSKLDEVFGPTWSFDVEEVGDMNLLSKTGHIVVKGTLTIQLPNGSTIRKMQYGSADVKLSRSSNRPVDIGDDFKSAASDALKKCASFLGVARDIYFRDWEKMEKNQLKPEESKAPKGAKVVKPEIMERVEIAEAQKQIFARMKKVVPNKEDMLMVLEQTVGKESFKDLTLDEIDKLNKSMDKAESNA